MKEKPKPTYEASTCEWIPDIPRKVVSRPGKCGGKSRTEVCTGYVRCKNVDATKPDFLRLSSCSPKNCNQASAVACTKEGGYSSKRADGAQGEDLDQQLFSQTVEAK